MRRHEHRRAVPKGEFRNAQHGGCLMSAGTAPPLLQVRGLESGYAGMRVLDGIDLEVRRGETVAVVGGNGAGKTTLMLMLAGLIEVSCGSLQFAGDDVTRWASHRRVDSGIVLVPEGRWVFPNLSVENNLRLGAITPRARANWRGQMEEVFALFPRLHERRRQLAGFLSGGEQQMLAIGRGLMARPKLLLLDEPTLGLAPIMAAHIFSTIRRLNQDGLSIFVAEQDVRHALDAAHTAYVIENGRIVMTGAGGELANDPRVRQAYLGL
jgi:branched-chain amino acid transport system ATP-binding protein